MEEMDNLSEKSDLAIELERRQKIIEDLKKKFLDDALECWDILVNLAKNSSNESIQLSAVKDILDRAGFKAVERKEVSGRDGGAIIISDEEKMKISRLIDQVVK